MTKYIAYKIGLTLIMAEKLICNTEVTLKRSPGKGGWTYAELANVVPQGGISSGYKKVRGFIDDYEITETHLFPMGNGHLFLPIKAAIRKKIGKEAGDNVLVQLYMEEEIKVEESDFLECLTDEPKALELYNALTLKEQQDYLDYVYSARTDEKKIERIVECINNLSSGNKRPPELSSHKNN
jgi:hypothetical protein